MRGCKGNRDDLPKWFFQRADRNGSNLRVKTGFSDYEIVSTKQRPVPAWGLVEALDPCMDKSYPPEVYHPLRLRIHSGSDRMRWSCPLFPKTTPKVSPGDGTRPYGHAVVIFRNLPLTPI